MMAAEHETPRGELRADISKSIVQLMHEHTGRGPMRARTYLEDDLVTVVLRDTMTAPEKRLVDAGESGIVLDLRHKFQMSMRDEAIASIEKLTGRIVKAFMSTNHLDPDVAAELFVLEPE
jgi:uncharacterized protein YbcI